MGCINHQARLSVNSSFTSSGPAKQEEDQGNDEKGSEYAATGEHMNLQSTESTLRTNGIPVGALCHQSAPELPTPRSWGDDPIVAGAILVR
jgi:hypothetical protein